MEHLIGPGFEKCPNCQHWVSRKLLEIDLCPFCNPAEYIELLRILGKLRWRKKGEDDGEKMQGLR